ncbi:hypothetical protein AMJ39_02980 [candidate division TA06 bacterium DG_24]|uniref:Release factor glutamine methyltransferase n=3 Tax=Bacteria division TA06 TaxID=1156500 RepID=A0A0S8G8A4_UNCT6|nr:MAG: hypothetical protein AMJ39_02980 [candidate division TA06 bacterium DG_24]KPK68395.1 MAG: hypothetical protein AMJ82_08365 [candidate division TA06 bacterium SM23_40]
MGRRALVLEAESRLRLCGVESPRREAELLLCHRLGVSRSELYLEGDLAVGPEDRVWLYQGIEQRCEGVPLQYIVGDVEFMGLVLKVDRRVFIPRSETEVLVDAVVAELADAASPLVLDVGTGCGNIAVALAVLVPGARLLASDISSDALDCARENAHLHQVGDRITFAQGDLYAPFDLPVYRSRLDAIVSNPPYVPIHEIGQLPREVRDHEPRVALDGGDDGLAVLGRLVREGRHLLMPGGLLAFEVGEAQADAVSELIGSLGPYGYPKTIHDYAHKERIILARTRSHRQTPRGER